MASLNQSAKDMARNLWESNQIFCFGITTLADDHFLILMKALRYELNILANDELKRLGELPGYFDNDENLEKLINLLKERKRVRRGRKPNLPLTKVSRK